MTQRQIARYGWKPDLPDRRDLVYAVPPPAALPPLVDLRRRFPMRPWDQGQLGSCTSHAIAGALVFEEHRQKLPVTMPSRLFIYYHERVLENSVAFDAGAEIRDGMKVVATVGFPPESDWPYDISQFAAAPPAAAEQAALKDRVTRYLRLEQTPAQLQGCLAAGRPFVFGFTVYESFESDQVARSGEVPMPAAGEKVLGGHAVVACGYDSGKRVFIVRNSWGTAWGKHGYFTIPFDYLLSASLASDFWTVEQEVEG